MLVPFFFGLLYGPKLPNTKREEVYLDPKKHSSKTQGRLIPLLTIDEDTRGAIPFKTPVDIFFQLVDLALKIRQNEFGQLYNILQWKKTTMNEDAYGK